jgi:sulfite reductase beta subunit-like hemoprotein
MPEELSRNERIKEASRYLRGTLAQGLAEEITGAIVEDDQQLVKFHGMYLQDDRDLRAERRRKKMEAAFAFMVRVRIPGGVLTPSQYLALDEIARLYAGNAMRITTRQTIQLHGIIKSNLRATMARIDAALLTTIAACGDVNATSFATRIRINRALTPPRSRRRAHCRTISSHARRRTVRFGSMERGSRAARMRSSSRSMARHTCRESSRSRSPCRRRTTSTSSRTILVTSRSSTRTAPSPATKLRSEAAWA